MNGLNFHDEMVSKMDSAPHFVTCGLQTGNCPRQIPYDMAEHERIILEPLKKENEKLKNRCFALTQGSLCFFCPIKCELRRAQFRNDEQTDCDILDKVIEETGKEEING